MSNNSFGALKKSRGTTLKNIIDESARQSTPGGGKTDDDRFWTPQRDRGGNGYAVFRFLPAPPNEDLPWVRMFNHAFKGPGGWLIDNCPTTLNHDCPVCKYNTELWALGTDEAKAQVREQKRKLSYVSNIYVIKDSSNPANEGKVFLYKYGKKIFDMINDVMNPQFADEAAINPFDFWEGATFKLKIRTVDKYPNYDKSEFDKPSALLDDDEALEAIWKQQHSLKDLIAPEKYKSEADLKSRLDKVIGLGNRAAPKTTREVVEEEEVAEVAESAFKKAQKKTTPPKKVEASGGDDDEMAFFAGLVEDDEIPY